MQDTAAQWIWCDADGAGRNVFARFRRCLALAAAPASAVLHLFADARWRLRINGAIVAYGPGRFVTAHPCYDSIDLAAHLRSGDNELLVEAWAPGSSTFQVMADSSGGFIAWGAAGAHDLATPGAWQVQRATAWDAQAPSYSFAQGPVEILDLARLEAEAWTVPVRRRTTPWGPLAPRAIPPLRLHVQPAAGVRLLAAIAGGERRLACRVPRGDGPPRGQRFCYALPIRSPVAQRVRLGLFWGPHWVNGAELAMRDDPLQGNRQNTEADLRAGWNLLYGEPEILTEVWAQHIALPDDVGLELGRLRWSAAVPGAQTPSQRGTAPADEAALATLGLAWSDAPTGGHPARDLAWDRPGRTLPPQLPAHLDAAADPQGWVALLDMGGEFLGHLRVRLSAPAGTVLDVASDERLRQDGLLGMYRSNPFVDGTDRFILPGGAQVVELFHPHGGRYVQLAIRPGGPGEVVLHGVEVRDHQVPVARDGAFACPDPVFVWTWEASYRTLQACVEDAFLDCPWRERGTYLGDALVEAATLAAFSRDVSVARRTLDLFAQSQRPDGSLQDCAPAWQRGGLGDFTLIWVLFLHQLWARDGDLAEVRRHWRTLERILASPSLGVDADGLCTLAQKPFIDWGVTPEDREPAGNACTNAFRIRALACAVELAGALGERATERRWRDEHDRALAAFRRLLWLPAAGRFARARRDGAALADGAALHANVLALAFGLASPEQEPAVLALVERAVAVNCARTLGSEPGYLELYFLAYALQGLYRHGRVALAEQAMREHWGYMRSHDAWTIWECLRRGEHGAGSLCHAWSTTPVRWFHERILGVRPLRVGDPTVMLVAPESALDAAEGVVPHPAGAIRVAWRREGGRLRIDASGPPGVELRVASGA